MGPSPVCEWGTCPSAHPQGGKQVLLQTVLVGKLGPFHAGQGRMCGSPVPSAGHQGKLLSCAGDGGLQLVHWEQK